ncbi:MAG TPA: peptidoglycan recognition family protein [Armatimonadota bacterium]|nr:peptidoglycan recognition family protein [Armatimonadota bacterium]
MIYRCIGIRSYRHSIGPKRYPVGIVIHHTASGPLAGNRLVDMAFINTMHKSRHFHPVLGYDGKKYFIAYHYVILQDGTIQHGRPEYLPGAHTKGHPNMLGIVLVGDFDSRSNHGLYGPLIPPPAQLASAERLTKYLMRKYHLSVSNVYLHRDLRPTACPGNCFPRSEFYRGISQ